MMSVRDGEISNLAPLFERHSAKLFNYYVRLTGNRQLSEDMVQDVFLRILTYRHTFRGESQFTTWMFSDGGAGSSPFNITGTTKTGSMVVTSRFLTTGWITGMMRHCFRRVSCGSPPKNGKH